MKANEALDVLGLKRGASAVEIKEAYRDMVKVWHPDRFGSDARLRRKAEDKLKEINDAYRVLQSGSTVAAVTETDAASARGDESLSSAELSYAPIHRSRRARPNWSVRGGWIKGGVSVALIVAAGYWVLEREPMHAARPLATPAQQAGDADSQEISKDPVVQDRLQDSVRSNDSSPAQFQVRSLSEAQTGQLESTCSRQKESHDQVAYQTCLKAQLDVMMGARGKPDLGGLSAVERESMESSCTQAKGHGADAYNRCVRMQMAELAAEPARPDMSTLNAADRDSIELACRTAKYRNGPSAYNRCRAGMIKLLMDSR